MLPLSTQRPKHGPVHEQRVVHSTDVGISRAASVMEMSSPLNRDGPISLPHQRPSMSSRLPEPQPRQAPRSSPICAKNHSEFWREHGERSRAFSHPSVPSNLGPRLHSNHEAKLSTHSKDPKSGNLPHPRHSAASSEETISVKSGTAPSEQSNTSSNTKSRRMCHICRKISALDAGSLAKCCHCQRRFHRGCHKAPIPSNSSDWKCYACQRARGDRRPLRQDLSSPRLRGGSSPTSATAQHPRLDTHRMSMHDQSRLQGSTVVTIGADKSESITGTTNTELTRTIPIPREEREPVTERIIEDPTSEPVACLGRADAKVSKQPDGRHNRIAASNTIDITDTLVDSSKSTPKASRRHNPALLVAVWIFAALRSAPNGYLTLDGFHAWLVTSRKIEKGNDAVYGPDFAEVLRYWSHGSHAFIEERQPGAGDSGESQQWILRSQYRSEVTYPELITSLFQLSVDSNLDTGPYGSTVARFFRIAGEADKTDMPDHKTVLPSTTTLPHQEEPSEASVHSVEQYMRVDAEIATEDSPANSNATQDNIYVTPSQPPASKDFPPSPKGSIVEQPVDVFTMLTRGPSPLTKDLSTGKALDGHIFNELVQPRNAPLSPCDSGENDRIPYQVDVDMQDATSPSPSSPSSSTSESMSQRVRTTLVPKFGRRTLPDFGRPRPGPTLKEIVSRPTRKQLFGKVSMSRLGPAAFDSMNDAIEQGLRQPGSNSSRSKAGEDTSLRDLLGLPDSMIPMIHDNQLAFRDSGISSATGRRARPKYIYKIG